MITLFSTAVTGLCLGPVPHTPARTAHTPHAGSTLSAATQFTPPPSTLEPDGASLTALPSETAPTTVAVAWVLLTLIVGAAVIGAIFFAPPPENERGPRRSGVLVAIRTDTELPMWLFVQRARRGLGHLHQEFQIVLALLEPVDQQVYRLMRIQPGQHPT